MMMLIGCHRIFRIFFSLCNRVELQSMLLILGNFLAKCNLELTFFILNVRNEMIKCTDSYADSYDAN